MSKIITPIGQLLRYNIFTTISVIVAFVTVAVFGFTAPKQDSGNLASSTYSTNQQDLKPTQQDGQHAASTWRTLPTTGSNSPGKHDAQAQTNASSGQGQQPGIVALMASPGSLDLSEQDTGSITVTYGSGASFVAPQLSYTNGLRAYVADTTGQGGASWLEPKWQVVVQRTSSDASGHGSVTIASDAQHSITVPVSWKPVPSFTVTKGSLVRTDDTDTITYTAHFKITPVNWGSSTPTIAMTLSGTSACTNTADLHQTVVYSGQNNFSMTCVVARPAASGAGDSTPPDSSLTFSIGVDVTLPDGSAVPGGKPLSFTAPAPYDH